MAETERQVQQRQNTRRRLAQAAQALFASRGFDATTVDEIATEAGVSRRTFFYHFASKEDVILSWHDEFEQALIGAIRAAPRELPLLDLTATAVIAALGQFDVHEALRIEQLKRDTPALRARDQGKYERLEQAIGAALAERAGLEPDELPVKVDAMLMTGILRVGSNGWMAAMTAGVPIERYVRDVIRTISASLAARPR